MVDNRGISPISTPGFKADNASANKMSEEKYGQGGEYFASEMQEEETQENQQTYQDRSAQLRASLNGLAAANAGSIMFMKTLKKREELINKAKNKEKQETNQEEQEQEELFED
ncbi:hypothetical protein IJ425_02025 [bacterium]|nr:hypothetical protein [bacterium]